MKKLILPSMSLCEMPSEVLLKIFSFLEVESLFALPRVCRLWREVCSRLDIEEIKWKNHPMEIEAFVVMLSKFGRIKSLDFGLGEERWNVDVNDLIVMELEKKYSGLKSLNLHFCGKVTDAGISKIGEGCPELRSLDLLGCHKVTGDGISKIGEGCPQLRSLNLYNCHRVTDVGISKIGEGCNLLRWSD